MRTIKPLAALASAVAAFALLVPSGSLAGTPVDPNLHDTLLGTVGGLRYARETVPYNPSNSNFADAEAGCGTQAWHLIGGGAAAGGAAAHAWQAFVRPDDYTDADSDPDDGFLADGFGPTGSSFTAYSICAQAIPLQYHTTLVGNQPTANRGGSAACGGPAWHVTTGGVAIATSGSWITSSFPTDGADADAVRDDGWRGTAYDTVSGIGGFVVSAVCAHGVVLNYLHAGPRTAAAGHITSNKIACAPSQHVVGGGAMVSGPPSEARLLVSAPFDGSDADTIPDDGWRTTVYNISGADKNVRTFAICLGG